MRRKAWKVSVKRLFLFSVVRKISVAVVIFPVQGLFPGKPGIVKQKKERGMMILEHPMSLGGEKRVGLLKKQWSPLKNLELFLFAKILVKGHSVN